MVISKLEMVISITEFKARCLEIIRQLEAGGQPVEIVRRGKPVARLLPALKTGHEGDKPWKRLVGSGVLLAEPGESVIEKDDFDAGR